jgi:hypothetical protein
MFNQRKYYFKINLLVMLLKKEVIHPQLPLRMPCYNLNSIAGLAFHSNNEVLGLPQLSNLDGQCVQNPRTYSPRRGWFAITSNSSFMKSNCRLQSVLRVVLKICLQSPASGLSVPFPLYHVCSPGHKGHADLTSFYPSSRLNTGSLFRH